MLKIICATVELCHNANHVAGGAQPAEHMNKKEGPKPSHLALKQLKQQRLQLLRIQLDLVCSCLSFLYLQHDTA